MPSVTCKHCKRAFFASNLRRTVCNICKRVPRKPYTKEQLSKVTNNWPNRI